MRLLLMCFSLLVSFCTNPAFAIKQDQVKRAEFQLNKASPNAMAVNNLGSLVTYQKKWVAKGTYSYAVQGGAVGTGLIYLKDSLGNRLTLPKGAIVHNCLLDFRTAGASAGTAATISIGTGQANNDLKSALAVASATGVVACVPVGSAATSIKLTADRTPTMSIGVEALTAGKLSVLIEYFMSDYP